MPRARARRAALLVLLPAVAAVAVALPANPAAGGAPAARAVVAAPVAAVAAPVPAAAPVSRHADPAHHTVVPGETLSHIAQRYGVGVARLAAANGIADPDHVRYGTTLVIPAAPATSSSGAVAATGLPPRLQQSPTRLSYIPIFDHWAAANGIPADLLKAMTWLESGWQNHLVSPTGAVGIGQLMPDTVEFMELLIGRDLDPAVVEDNIRMSARYLRWLLGRYGGDPARALAAYYQGPASVERQGTLAETDVYVENALALRRRF